jgi:protein phosphatase methylesterase 1
MPIDLLLEEATVVLKWVVEKFEDASIIITGHSLGGAMAAKLAYGILHPEESKESEIDKNHIVGVFVIDVAEGSAIGALPFMEQIVESRPTEFESVKEAIKWGVVSGQVRRLESARVTMPDLVKEQDGKVVFKNNLLASKDHWKEWFLGMNKCFLECNIPKTLVIASNDRMDKELTIAQRQGKF